MSLFDTKAGVGAESGHKEVFKIESFDELDASQGRQGSRDTFESTYDETYTADSFRLVSLHSEADEADDIIEGARRKAAAIESEAYEKGFAQGEKDGFELGTKKVEKLIDHIEAVLRDMAAHKELFAAKHEKEVLDLICAIAEKVIRGAAKVDNQVVREAVFEAFRIAADRSEVTVRVNPEQVEYMKEIRPEFFGRINELKSIKIEADPSIAPGGCFMETAFGNVDSRVETQLERIAEVVERVYEEEIAGVENGRS